MTIHLQIETAKKALLKGGIIAYPTEAVYGFGCDPLNREAVQQLLRIKKRPESAGLILLIAHWEQLMPLIAPINSSIMEKIRASWPGHTTWLFPKSNKIPDWISGSHASVAIRMTNHPVAKHLCDENPLVSTSANTRGTATATSIDALQAQFSTQIDAFVDAPLGNEPAPSIIIDALTGLKIR